MNKIITHNEYIHLLIKEQDLFKSISSVQHISQENPSDDTVNNILNFSKAYSCRKSASGGYIEEVLN